MQLGKRSLIAGVIVFIGVMAIVLVVYNFIRLYAAMPSKSDVINFAQDMTDASSDISIGDVGSLVPRDSTSSAETVPETAVRTHDTEAADWLTKEQRRMLSMLGIDESKLPTTLTPELEACFVKAIGEARVAAIKAGDSPTVVEGMKAVSCL